MSNPFLEQRIQQELNKLDRDLFLDKDIEFGTVVWNVKHFVGSGHPPMEVLSWKDPLGRPLDLSMSIVDKVKANEGSIEEAIRQITINNALKVEKARLERHEAQEEISREFERSARVLHRSGPWRPGLDVTGYSNRKPFERRVSSRPPEPEQE